jgi:hypothetical protein
MMSEEPIQPDFEQAGEVTAETVHLENSAALQATAERDAVVNNSAVVAVVAGRDAQMVNSLVGGSLVVGRDLTMEQSVAAFATVGDHVNVNNGTLGVLIASGPVTLSEGSRVLMTTRQAAAFGAALGAVFALLSLLFRRK